MRAFCGFAIRASGLRRRWSREDRPTSGRAGPRPGALGVPWAADGVPAAGCRAWMRSSPHRPPGRGNAPNQCAATGSERAVGVAQPSLRLVRLWLV